MKKLSIILLSFTLFSFIKPATDDTSTLQAMFNNGATTLLAGHQYHISRQLNNKYNINLNGATINYSGVSGTVIKQGTGTSIINGTFVGKGNVYSASGVSAIDQSAGYCTTRNLRISNFTGYGIVGSGAKPDNEFDSITKTGNMAYFWVSGKLSTTGGIFSHNTIDRSTQGTGIYESGYDIRGDINFHSSGWVIQYNKCTMPNTDNLDGAGSECRYLDNALISYNSFYYGGINLSNVGCNGLIVEHNLFVSSSSQGEGEEFAGCNYCIDRYNKVVNPLQSGFLVDAGPSQNITFLSDTVINATGEAFHLYNGVQNITIINPVVQGAQKAVNIQGATSTTIINPSFDGGANGQQGIMLDTTTGGLYVLGGTMANFPDNKVYAFSWDGITTNNVYLYGLVTSNCGGYDSDGVTLGSSQNVK